MTTSVLPHPTSRASDPGPAPAPHHQPTGFRADIQGLRALAVLVVAFDHADIGPFDGGFVGVDVFFVVSGFLITQLLLAEWQRSGSISLSGFYARRARRILPAATLVLIVTVVAGLLLLNFVRAKALVGDAVWVTFFAGNVHFGQQGTDYFAADTPPSALQHYWSLAVEEQFYLVWPLLLILLLGCMNVGRRRRHIRGGNDVSALARVLVGLGLVIGASFVLCLERTSTDPTGAYFSTLARVWELGLGAACAVLVTWFARMPPVVGAVMQWTGLAMIGSAVLTYGSATPFPGRAALLPVVGTALVLAGGCGRRAAGIRAVLENRSAQVVGDWSYSLYLWHWPVLVIAAEYAGHRLGWQQNALLLVLAFGLAGASYSWVESPFRRARLLSIRPRASLLMYPLAVGLTLAVCVGVSAQIRHEVAARATVAAVTTQNFGGRPGEETFSRDPHRALVQASALAALNHAPIPGQLSPGILALSDDRADVGDCDYDVTGTRRLCERGVTGSPRTIVLFGDSHARHWIPAVDQLADLHGYSAYYLVKPACSAAQIDPPAGQEFVADCLDWRRWAIQQIENLRPSVLVLAGEVPEELRDADGDWISDDDDVVAMFRSGLQETLDMVSGSAEHVFVIGDPPGLTDHPADCLADRGHDLGDCASPPSDRDELEIAAARAAAGAARATFVPTQSWFCYRDLCPAVVGATITYWDRTHITREYARQLAPKLDAKLRL